MDAERALRLAEMMREDFQSRKATLDLCRHYGYQMRVDGSPAYQNDRNDRLSPLTTSVPASLAWRLAMYLHANTLGVGNVFFGLDVETKDPKKRVSKADRNAVSDQTFKVIRRLFDTNFSSETNIAFNDLAVIGNNVTECRYDEATNKFVFRSYSVGNGVYFGDDSLGRCDMFCRFFKYDAKQALQEFGKQAGARVEEALNGKTASTTTQFVYVWLVYPREVFREEVASGRWKKSPSSKKRFGSVIVDVQERRVVKEDGYDDFPFAATTWQKRGGTAYGYGPIEMSIADIKDLLEYKHLKRKAVRKTVNPPIVVSSLWEGISTDENAVTFVEGEVGNMMAPLPIPTNLPQLAEDINECVKNIRLNLMLDAFEALNETTKYMTTSEVNGRIGQSVRAIAPIVSRIHNQYFSPLIRRVFNIMVDRGEITLPAGVEAGDMTVKYFSVLDSMILQGESSKMQEFVGFVMNLIQARAGLGDEFDCYLDMEAILNHVADYYNVPTDVVRDSKQIMELLEDLSSRRDAARQQELQAAMVKPLDMQKRSQQGSPMSGYVRG